MSSLIPTAERGFFTTGILDHFDTFSRNIVIFKEPKKTFSSLTTAVYPGYGAESQETNVSHTIVSGVYPAIINYNIDQKQNAMQEIKVAESKGKVKIKVKQDARSYINVGKTEYIQVDGIPYNQISDEAAQSFVDALFYIYFLERTT